MTGTYYLKEYPEKITLCPKCKEHTLWIPQEGYIRCGRCGHRQLVFEDIHAQDFIRKDVIEKLVMKFIEPFQRECHHDDPQGEWKNWDLNYFKKIVDEYFKPKLEKWKE